MKRESKTWFRIRDIKFAHQKGGVFDPHGSNQIYKQACPFDRLPGYIKKMKFREE